MARLGRSFPQRPQKIQGARPFNVLINAAGGSSGNLLSNPSVEGSIAPWSGYLGTVARSTAQANSGSSSGAMTCTDTSQGYYQAGSELVACTPGETVDVSAYVGAGGGTRRTVQVQINWHDSGGGYLSSSFGASALEPASGFALYTAEGVCPAGAVQCALVIAVNSPALSEVHYFDDGSLVRSGTGGIATSESFGPTTVSVGGPFGTPYVADAAHASGSSTSITGSLPSTLLLDELMIAIISYNTNGTITPPTGWTQIGTGSGTTSTLIERAYWKRAVAGEATPTWTTTVSTAYVVTILRIKGATKYGNPIGSSVFGGSVTNTSTPSAGAVTTAYYNELIVDWWASVGSITVASAMPDAGNGLGLEVQADTVQTASVSHTVAGTYQQSDPGSISARSVTLSASANSLAGSIVVLPMVVRLVNQDSGSASTNVSSFTVTGVSTGDNGNVLIAAVNVPETTSHVTSLSGVATTWRKIGEVGESNGTYPQYIEIWEGQGPFSGTTVTVNLSPSTKGAAVVYEFTGDYWLYNRSAAVTVSDATLDSDEAGPVLTPTQKGSFLFFADASWGPSTFTSAETADDYVELTGAGSTSVQGATHAGYISSSDLTSHGYDWTWNSTIAFAGVGFVYTFAPTAMLHPDGIAAGGTGIGQVNMQIPGITGIASGEAFGTPSALNQTLYGTGIASAEAIGTAKLNHTVYPTAVGSSETIGSASLTTGPVNVSPTGIATGYASGSAQVNHTVYPTAVASAEAFGSASLTMGPVSVSVTGIATSYASGTASVNVSVNPTGIVSGGAIGGPSVSGGLVSLFPTAIGSSEAFGTASANHSVFPTAIASAEALGSSTLTMGAVSVTPTGIASGEALGTPSSVTLALAVAGIATSEAFGTASLLQTLYATGAASAGAFGNPTLALLLGPTGIGSSYASGTATMTPGAVSVSPTGIGTGEALGVAQLNHVLYGAGISSGEAFGNPALTLGAISVSPSGVVSTEAFGTASLAFTLYAAGIGTAEAFGSLSVALGAVSVAPTGIASDYASGSAALSLTIYGIGRGSSEVFGSAIISQGALTLGVEAIDSEEALGDPAVALLLGPDGVLSGETFGNSTLNLTLYGTSTASGEAFGSLDVTLDLGPTGIPTAEVEGSPTLNLTLNLTGIVSAEVVPAPRMTTPVFPSGVPSSEVFGALSVQPGAVQVLPSGVASGEFVEDPACVVGSVSVSPPSVSSGEAFGTASLSPGAVSIGVSGAASGEAFGNLVVNPGDIDLSPTGIPGEEAAGTPAIRLPLGVSAIASGEAFGALTLTAGAVEIDAVAIDSGEDLGDVIVQPGVVLLLPQDIDSEESIGGVEVDVGAAVVSPSSVPSLEAFGVPLVPTTIYVSGIPSSEAFGIPNFPDLSLLGKEWEIGGITTLKWGFDFPELKWAIEDPVEKWAIAAASPAGR